MSDLLARRVAASALALALLALALAAWSAWRAESELRDLRRAVERAIEAPARDPLGPPLEFDPDF